MNNISIDLCRARDVDEERRCLPDVIYLVPQTDGEYGHHWVWCEDPAPTEDHVPEEAVKYVRLEDKVRG